MTAGTKDSASGTIFNVPNQLSAARFVLSIVVFVLIPLGQYTAALVVFIIAASTDWVDGWWARKYGQVTKLGRMLDPFVDKIIICGTFILLAAEMSPKADVLPWYSMIAGWMAVVVVGRELLVTALRSFIEQSGGDFSAKMAGKLKMVFQCVAVGAALVALMYDGLPPDWILWTLTISVWLAVISTVYSGLEYVAVAAKFLRR